MTTIAVGSGLSAQILVQDEDTYGVAADLESADSFEFKSETLELKKTAVMSEGLAAGKVYDRTKRRVVTNYDASGELMLDGPTRNLGFWLRYMVGDFTDTPTEFTTTGVYKTVYQPVDTLFGHSFTLQKGVPAVDATVEPFTYVGCKLSSWEIGIATGGLMSLTFNIDGRNELAGSGNGDPLNVSVPALGDFATPTDGLGLSNFHFREATLFSGGTPTLTDDVVSLTSATALGNVKDFTVKQAFSFDTNRVFVGGSGYKSEQIENGIRKLTGSFVIEWLSSEAIYDAYAEDTTTSLQLTFTGPIAGSSGANHELLDIIIPSVKLEGESPKVGGPAVVTQTANYSGFDDETTTPIQITYQSEDSGQ